MRGALEAAAALTLATALHAAGLVWVDDHLSPQDATAAQAGDQGSDSVTLAALPSSMAGMLERWDAPPQTATPADLPDAPTPEAAPAVQPAVPAPVMAPRPDALIDPAKDTAPALDTRSPAPRALESAAPQALRAPSTPEMSLPDLPNTPAQTLPRSLPMPRPPDQRDSAALPQVDSAAPPQPRRHAPRVSERPQARPAPPAPRPAPQKSTTKASPRKPASAASQQIPSAGRKAQTAAGTDNTAPQPSRSSAAQIASAKARWSAQLRQRIARAQRYPRGTRATGTVVVKLKVTRQGRVVGASIARGSGDATLDQAALRAVNRARLPAAPSELTDAAYFFQIPLAFRR
ncbi:energy transducer TonB [Primorskyibacter marinus]|uniref:energy transducer TonB n=1 Tax=Primorskyibacter marinus TaxID=1977320 RepID=UPI000E303821|nr:TonB family protein [Primorskyibacter marinus]